MMHPKVPVRSATGLPPPNEADGRHNDGENPNGSPASSNHSGEIGRRMIDQQSHTMANHFAGSWTGSSLPEHETYYSRPW